jgi:hypothetical protein
MARSHRETRAHAYLQIRAYSDSGCSHGKSDGKKSDGKSDGKKSAGMASRSLCHEDSVASLEGRVAVVERCSPKTTDCSVAWGEKDQETYPRGTTSPPSDILDGSMEGSRASGVMELHLIMASGTPADSHTPLSRNFLGSPPERSMAANPLSHSSSLTRAAGLNFLPCDHDYGVDVGCSNRTCTADVGCTCGGDAFRDKQQSMRLGMETTYAHCRERPGGGVSGAEVGSSPRAIPTRAYRS